jgi:hypothetical protein
MEFPSNYSFSAQTPGEYIWTLRICMLEQGVSVYARDGLKREA